MMNVTLNITIINYMSKQLEILKLFNVVFNTKNLIEEIVYEQLHSM